MLTKKILKKCTDRELDNMLNTTEQQIDNPQNTEDDTKRLKAELKLLKQFYKEKLSVEKTDAGDKRDS